MDKKSLEKYESNLNWLENNGGKLSLTQWFNKLYEGVDVTPEELIHFRNVIVSALEENKALNKKLA